jgi:uncharacterized RDD family membrane protein YckC
MSSYVMPMRDVHVVRTSEHVRIEFEVAGLGTRGLAYLVDLAVMFGMLGCAAWVFSALFGLLAGFANALYFVALFAIQWGYGATLEWRWRGQTVGKRLLGIRVVSAI